MVSRGLPSRLVSAQPSREELAPAQYQLSLGWKIEVSLAFMAGYQLLKVKL